MQNSSPKKWALLIGIDDYPNLHPGDQLYGCTNDVNLMHNLLLRRFRFAKRDIKRLCNKEATRAGILKAFRDLVERVERNDVVVVFFAGHGSHLRDATKGSGWTETMVPHDSGRRSTGHPSTDITDIEVNNCLLEPLTRKTPSVTLFFDSCHSASIGRDGFGTAVRGIDPDGDTREIYGINSGEVSDWLPTPNHRGGDSLNKRYALLAACRASEMAMEIAKGCKKYGAFTYLLCKLINESGNEDMRTLFRLASADVTALFPHQHPILEGAPNALIFGTYRLETPRYLPIKKIETNAGTGKTLVEMDGGLASGVTCGSIWAVRPLGNSPQNSDAQIEVTEASSFASRAKVIHPGCIKVLFGCFEISHVHGGPVLNILVDKREEPQFKEELSKSGNSNVYGTLNIVENDANPDVKVAFLKPRITVANGDVAPHLGPLIHETWVALALEGRIILPHTPNLSDLCENLRKLARYRFGLRLRNLDEHNELQGKLSLELKWRPKTAQLVDPWRDHVPMGMDNFPLFRNGDHIACVVRNHSDVTVWPYVLEFAEDGSVHQRYPHGGGQEQLISGKSTTEVAKMSLCVSRQTAFQLVNDIRDGRNWMRTRDGAPPPRKHFTEVLKLFAATEPIDLSLLLQTSFAQNRSGRGLSSLLRLGVPFNGDRSEGCGWWTVERPFVLESDWH